MGWLKNHGLALLADWADWSRRGTRVGGPLSMLIDFYSNTKWGSTKSSRSPIRRGETIEMAADMVLKFALPNLPLPCLGWTVRQVGAAVDAGMLDQYSWTNIRARGGRRQVAVR